MASAKSIVSVTEGAHEELESRHVWGVPTRIAHWLAALSIVGLIATGFYIAQPFAYSQGEAYDSFVMGRVRQFHFAFGYVLLVAFLVRIFVFFTGNNYARSGFPFVWRAQWRRRLGEQIREYLTIRVGARYVGHNQLGGLSYVLFVVVLGGAQILTGFAMYSETNPGGFWDRLVGWVIPLAGGSWQVHQWHHLLTWGFLLFVVVHVYVVVLESVLLKNGLVASIITGRKFVRKGDVDSKTWIS